MKSLKLILSNRQYFAPAWVFASLNILIGTWVLYIPFIKKKLEISDGDLGNALFSLALGTLVIMPVSSKIINRLGLGKATFVSTLILIISFCFPILAESYNQFVLALFFFGVAIGITDISMNSLVSSIEQKNKVFFMSASHGFFSIGGFIGAVLGTYIIRFIEVPFYHIILIAIAVLAMHLFLAKNYYSLQFKIEKKKKEKYSLKLLMPLIPLTVIAFIVMGSEGAIEHWSKLYLEEVISMDSENSSLGFIMFSLFMAFGRFYGDGVSKKIGAINVIILGALVGSFGFLTTLSSATYISVLGFALIGIGFSIIVPEIFRLAGKEKNVSPALGISFVAGFGYLGFLLSPPVLGLLSEVGTLRLSFLMLMILSLIAFAIGITLKKIRYK